MLASLRPTAGLLSGTPHYLHWGVIQISVANLLILVATVVVFVLALVLPFPGGSADQDQERSDARR